jgi:hypothetical protein
MSAADPWGWPMGFLDRLPLPRGPLAPTAATAPAWSADGAWCTTWEAPRNWIRGESQHVAAIAAIAGPVRERGYLIPVDVVLEREPKNAYDPNAVRALVRGVMVGRLAREIAAQVSPAMAAAKAKRLVVPGVVRGGSPRYPSIGVHIWLDRGEGEVRLLDDSDTVSWPPRKVEGRS